MFLKIWEDFINRKVFSYFILTLICIFGLISINALPKESSPEVQIPVAIIQTFFLGAAPDEVESQVTSEIEDAIDGILGISEITSSSSSDISSIIIQFDQDENIDEKIDEIKSEVDKIKVNFSNDISDPVITDIKISEQPIFTFSISSNKTDFELQMLASDLEDHISNIKGVSKVFYNGLSEKEISILVNPEKLDRYNLTLDNLSTIIRSSDNKTPIGGIEIKNQNYSLNINNSLKTIDDIRNIPIKISDSVIYLKDVANISLNFKKNDVLSKIYFSDSKENKSLIFYVTKEKGYNLMDLTDNLKSELEKEGLKGGILDGIKYQITLDLGSDSKKELFNLTKNGFTAIFLVFLVLYFVLGLGNSFIAAIGIPITFLLSFIFFYIIGNTLNFISMFSMILAIGILVDSDIVITEGIAKRKEDGLSEEEASRSAVIDLSGPMVAGTATTVAVFLPLFFLSGITGDFISAIPFTIVFILISSQFVSVFIVPLLHGIRFKFKSKFINRISNPLGFKEKKENIKNKIINNNFYKKFSFKKFENKYQEVLLYFFAKNKRVKYFFISIIIIFIITLIIPASGILKSTFFPEGDVPYIYMDIEGERGSSLGDTNLIIDDVSLVIKKYDFYDSVILTAGKSSDFNPNGSQIDKRFGNILINLKGEFESEGKVILNDLRNDIEKEGLTKFVLVSSPESGPPSGAPIDFKVLINDEKLLKEASLLAEKILNEINGVINIKSDLEKNNTGIYLNIDRSKAAFFDVPISKITSTIAMSIKGIKLLELKNINETLEVYLKYDLRNNGEVIGLEKINVDDLKNIKIKNNKNKYIYLSSIVEITPKSVESNINHFNKIRSISIKAETSDDVNLKEVISLFNEKFEEEDETGAVIKFGGSFAEQEQSFGETGMAFMGGLALMFGILIFLFNSIRLPIIVESVIPLAFSGVVFGLLLTGNDLSFPAILGFISLSGIIVNNSILLIYSFETERKKMNYYEVKYRIDEIIVKGTKDRFRPIILTTITTIFGIMPLIFSSAIWAPIAYSIIFGLLFATIITLIFIPLLYRKYYPKK